MTSPQSDDSEQLARHLALLLWLTAVGFALRVGYRAGVQDGRRQAVQAVIRGYRNSVGAVAGR